MNESSPQQQYLKPTFIDIEAICAAGDNKLAAAEAYAAQSIALFPHRNHGSPPGMSPKTHWVDRPDAVRKWFGPRGKFGGDHYFLGLACGKPSGIVVVDVDVKGAINGVETLTTLLGGDPELIWADAPMARTPSGGYHYFFECPADGWPRQMAKTGNGHDGVDICGDGQYVRVFPTPGMEWVRGGSLTPLPSPILRLRPQTTRPDVANVTSLPPGRGNENITANDLIGAMNPIRSTFNENNDPVEILEQHGYISRGQSADGKLTNFLPPDSSSGVPGVRYFHESQLVFSHHGSDALAGMGACDAFALWAILDRGIKNKAELLSRYHYLLAEVKGRPEIQEVTDALPLSDRLIVDKNGRPLKDHDNLNTILNSREFAGAVGKPTFDTFANTVMIGGRPIEDETAFDAQVWMARTLGIQWGKDETFDGLLATAAKNKYDPLYEYFEQLPDHDPAGPSAIEELYSVLGIGDNSKLIVRTWLLQGPMLAYEPHEPTITNGLDMPHAAEIMLIIQGPQGLGKSKWSEAISPKPEWFTNQITSQLTGGGGGRNDEVGKLRGRFIVEMPELTPFKRRTGGLSTDDEIKQFLSTTFDVVRMPYARVTKSIRRRSMFIGTVNDATFLNDNTGSRRYSVVTPQPEVIEGNDKWWVGWTVQNRDRIWAEAKYLYRVRREKPYFTDLFIRNVLMPHNKKFVSEDILQPWVVEWASTRSRFTTLNVAMECLSISTDRASPSDNTRIAGILTKEGYLFKNIKYTNLNGKHVVQKMWVNPDKDVDARFTGTRWSPTDDVHEGGGPEF